jgi:mannose-1-phosphate guanylyltransferase
MILAAGLGTRLRPLTLKTPKPLIKLQGKFLISYALDYMFQAGVQKIAINTHYLADQIPKALGDNYKGIPITYIYEPEILGTGGALKNACEQVLGFDEPVLLMNSDIALDLDLPAFLATHENAQPVATLLVKTVERGENFVEIGSDSKGYVQGMIGLIPYAGPPLLERQFCGVHIISSQALKKFPAQKSFGIIDAFYVPLIKSGAQILAVEQTGYYSDLGTLESLKEAEQR